MTDSMKPVVEEMIFPREGKDIMFAVVMIPTASIGSCIDSQFLETLAAESRSTPIGSWKQNISFPSHLQVNDSDDEREEIQASH